MKKMFFALVAAFATLALAVGASATVGDQANGHGAYTVTDSNGKSVKRQFSFSAKINADGSVNGSAELSNPAFTGANNKSPYHVTIDVTCLNVIGNTAFVGGLVRNTNDTGGGVLTGAVFFSVQDNGEPGKDQDRISPLFFWDNDPNTVGDPQACLLNQLGDFPMTPIEEGNIQVRSAS